ncbi:hypothetical protein AGMMS49940_02240 [Spirochaetia bacterium]|nr:hypothetical protein AGMMS49940_02240 [Spirochaetia bacterium]
MCQDIIYIFSNVDQNGYNGSRFVFGELLQGVKNKREEEIILDYWKHLPKIDNDTEITISAGIYSHKNKLIDKGVGLIDSIIWTLDTNIPPIYKVPGTSSHLA